MTKFIATYYKGGHRVMLGGVPCRVSRLPKHEGGKALMAQSSREMCAALPPRNRKDRAQWERQQIAAYQAAEKLGDRSIDDVVTITATAPTATTEPIVEQIAAPIVREPFRVPSRPVTRARGNAMSGAMKTVNYYRVSTVRQGRSGLGLEAQRAAVESFCAGRGCDTIAEYVEIESGKDDARPELAKALHHARITGATVIISKLDRLSRNVAFLAQLQDGGVKFLCADMPEANELTLHIMAAMAQAERKAISRRTKEALAAAKERGTKLGNPMGADAFGKSAARGRVAGVVAIKAKAQGFAADVLPIVDAIKADGHTSLRAIAAELNARGIMTARGGRWAAQTVSDLLKR